MMLTPAEIDRLTLFTAAELARKRRARGLRLNQPEAVALIADGIMGGGAGRPHPCRSPRYRRRTSDNR